MKLFSILSVGVAMLVSNGAFAKTFQIDTEHSSVSFKVKHLVISNVEGRFKEFSGSFEVDSKSGDLVGMQAVVQAASIDTNNVDRDKHLRNADFFDVEKPGMKEISFVADKFSIKKGASGKVSGKLKMKGVTKPVTFDVEYAGEATDPWGNKKAGFSAKLNKLNRKDFGLTWNKALEAGGVLVGDEVNISVEIEGNHKEEKSKK